MLRAMPFVIKVFPKRPQSWQKSSKPFVSWASIDPQLGWNRCSQVAHCSLMFFMFGRLQFGNANAPGSGRLDAQTKPAGLCIKAAELSGREYCESEFEWKTTKTSRLEKLNKSVSQSKTFQIQEWQSFDTLSGHFRVIRRREIQLANVFREWIYLQFHQLDSSMVMIIESVCQSV